jgi:hypothetical protein
MLFEPSGSCPPVQQAGGKRCQACRQARLLAEFFTTGRGGLANSSCRDCRRATSRLASRRQTAAMRLLIAAHPEEWVGLLGLVRAKGELVTSHPGVGGRGA